MKKISIALAISFLFFFSVACAQSGDNFKPALIVPGNIFYGLKIFGESLKEKIMSLGGTESEASYISQRVANRAQELITLETNGKIDTPAYIEADNSYHNLKIKLDTILNEVNIKDQYDIAQKELKASLSSNEEELAQNRYQALLIAKMDDIRNQIAEANNSGNDATKLKEDLNTAEQNYNEANVIAKSVQEENKQQEQTIENSLSGADKINYALDWANKYKQMIADTSQNKAYQGSDSLFADANKTINDLISNLKKIPLDNIDNKQLDNLFQTAGNSLNDTARTIYQKSLGKNVPQQPVKQNVSQQIPSVVPQQPTTQQPAVKPKLKTIPSASVNTEPLSLTDIGNLNGKVGEYKSFTFSATGGLPPYHYQLESGSGFPPMGMVLSPDGVLSGTPKAEGSRTFGVTVVDTAGKTNWLDFTMTVDPKEAAPQPAPVPVATCDEDAFGRAWSQCKEENRCPENSGDCAANIPSSASNYDELYHQCGVQQCQCDEACGGRLAQEMNCLDYYIPTTCN